MLNRAHSAQMAQAVPNTEAMKLSPPALPATPFDSTMIIATHAAPIDCPQFGQPTGRRHGSALFEVREHVLVVRGQEDAVADAADRNPRWMIVASRGKTASGAKPMQNNATPAVERWGALNLAERLPDSGAQVATASGHAVKISDDVNSTADLVVTAGKQGAGHLAGALGVRTSKERMKNIRAV